MIKAYSSQDCWGIRILSIAFGLPYLLVELFYIGMPVVRMDSLSVYGHMITKFSRIGRFPHFLTHDAPLHVLLATCARTPLLLFIYNYFCACVCVCGFFIAYRVYTFLFFLFSLLTYRK